MANDENTVVITDCILMLGDNMPTKNTRVEGNTWYGNGTEN